MGLVRGGEGRERKGKGKGEEMVCGGVQWSVVCSLSTYIQLKYRDLPVAVDEE